MTLMNMTLGDVISNAGSFPIQILVLLYFAGLLGSVLYGVDYGIREWLKWLETRKPIKLIKKFAWCEPIVNVAKDGGYGMWHVIMCATSNAFVAATFIVSVPIITLFFSETEEDSKNTAKKRNH